MVNVPTCVAYSVVVAALGSLTMKKPLPSMAKSVVLPWVMVPVDQLHIDGVDIHASADLLGIASADGRRACGGQKSVAERISEIDLRGLEAVCVDVGNVIANDVHVCLEGVQSAYTSAERDPSIILFFES